MCFNLQFFLEKFVILIYDLYAKVCLGFEKNWILLLYDEIEFDFVI